MRIDFKDKFSYVLNRGIPVSSSDKNYNNLLHYAVSLERLDYLYFLFGGKFDNYHD